MDTMQVENPPALNQDLNQGQRECRPNQRPSTAESVFVVDADPTGPGGIHDIAKYAKALGIVHIVCGLVHMPIPALLSSAAGDSILSPFQVAGVLPSVLFLLSGCFAIQGARKKSRCLVSASQTLSVFSTIAAGLLLIKSWGLLSLFVNSSSQEIFGKVHPIIPSIMALLVGATMLIAATISAALPCAIQEPQDNVPKVPRSTSSTSYVGDVAHLVWALLLILADIVSDRHVGEKHEEPTADHDGRQRTWQAVTGFTLPPGILTSVGIFLLASSLLSMVSVKKSSKVLHISAIVPSVYAAVSAGIGLYVCCVSVANEDYAKYDLLVKEYQHNGLFTTPFPISLAIFGALILLITTSATSLLFTMKIGRADSNLRNTLTENSNSFKYTQFLD